MMLRNINTPKAGNLLEIKVKYINLLEKKINNPAEN